MPMVAPGSPLSALAASRTRIPSSTATSRYLPLGVTRALVAARDLLLETWYCAPMAVRLPPAPVLNTSTSVSVTTKTALPSLLTATPNGLPPWFGTCTAGTLGRLRPCAAAVLQSGAFSATARCPLFVPPPSVPPPPPPLVSAYAAAPPPIRTTTAATSARGDFHHGRTMLACGSDPPYWP